MQSLFVLLAVSLVVFFAVYAVGDPIELLVNAEASEADRQAMIRRLGLDLPVWQQYTGFLLRALQGDLGNSFVHGVPAIELIVQRIPATLELVLVAITLTIVIGIPLGLLAGLRNDKPTGRGLMAGSVLGFSLPSFWQGMVLILCFAVWLRWLPAAGRGDTVSVLGVPLSLVTADGWKHVMLPAVNLALANIALVLRLTATGVVDAKTQEYVKFARAKGLKPRRILTRHILRNILIPVVTVIGMEFGSLIAYSTITETCSPGPAWASCSSTASTSSTARWWWPSDAGDLHLRDDQHAGGHAVCRAGPARAVAGIRINAGTANHANSTTFPPTHRAAG